MGTPKETLARIAANRSMRRLHETLKPILISAGVRGVETQIGRPQLFFQRTRERDALRMSDYLAACVTLDQDPAELLAKALRAKIDPEIRRPRIVSAAWKRISTPGVGLGEQRIQELEALRPLNRKKLRVLLKQELDRAAQDELPLILGLYASVLQFDGDLSHSALVFQEAIEMARTLEVLAVEAHLLIRMAYMALEWQSPVHALKHAQEGTLAYACLGELEGEARGFLAMGLFRYYTKDYHRSLQYNQAALDRSEKPKLRFSAHLNSAFCSLALDQEEQSHRFAEKAQQLASQVDAPMRAKLLWFQARISYNTSRFDQLKATQEDLAVSRPADCLLVTLELIEEYLSHGRLDKAAEEIPLLCDLVEHAAECRQVQQAVSRLIRHRSRLTPQLTENVRRALDRARDRRLTNLVSEEL